MSVGDRFYDDPEPVPFDPPLWKVILLTAVAGLGFMWLVFLWMLVQSGWTPP